MAACLVSGSAFAYVTGNVGYSGKQSGSTTCMGSGCHSGGATPTVTLEGPATLEPGATGNYSLIIKGGAASRGGFNVAVSAGSLTAGSGQRKESGELTHTQSKAFASGEARFDFTLVAPASGATITLFGAGNSTNGDQQPEGDGSALSQKTITVGDGGGGGDDDEGGCAAAGGVPLLGAVLLLVGARLRRRR
jgi:uncharacterized protein (TIGR03382 family)